ncbi:unnamed protein product [Arabis nemorensis]|uniref:Uncharacterized protein n=1 Tax=Arabis nemorensis TaxID=586526 RepID=A0A565AYS4_9BRAS|nr:unnamed protein product [Arabis nemorensis]
MKNENGQQSNAIPTTEVLHQSVDSVSLDNPNSPALTLIPVNEDQNTEVHLNWYPCIWNPLMLDKPFLNM